MRNVSFDNPWLLLVAVPLAVVILLPYLWAIRKENKTKATVTSLILHFAIVVVLTLALAGTILTTYMTKTEVIYVADVSFSTNKNLQLIDDYITKVHNDLPHNTQASLVCFGKDYKLMADFGEEIPSVQGSGVDDSATDISQALSYAATLFSSDTLKHIVLLTDGNETDPNAANNLVRAVEELYAKNIYLDVMYIDSNMQENEKEVQVTSVEAAASTYLNHSAKVTALLQAGATMDATVSLYKDGELVDSTTEQLDSGYNLFTFELDTSGVGTFDYEVRVVAEGDMSPHNNSCSFSQSITGKLNVLLITTNPGDVEAAQLMFGSDAVIDSYVNDPWVPCTVEELCKYDQILISSTDVSTLQNNTAFVDSLDKVVSVFGKSLINIGNSNIQSSPEEIVKEYAGMLPVKYGNSADDGRLYVLLLDTSRSMNFASKMNYAKLVAANVLNVLNDNDQVMVIGFAGSPKVIYTVSSASNRELLVRAIYETQLTQGTVLTSALQATYEQIVNMPFEEKQVMLISDGLSYAQDEDPATIASNMRAQGIKVSTVTITNTSDQAMMERIAAAGGGKNFQVNSNKDAADVVYDDIGSTMGATIIEEDTLVNIQAYFDPAVNGLKRLPNVMGFVQSKAKSDTTVVATVPYQKPSGSVVDVPLYAYWNYGEGTVACFTSDLLGKWTGHWKDNNGQGFLENVAKAMVPDERVDYPYTLNVEFDGVQSLVEVMPVTINPYATLDMQVTRPDGSVDAQTLRFDRTRYYYEFLTPMLGKYQVQITYSYGNNTYVNTAVFHIDRSPEYDSFVLYSAATLTSAVRDRGTVYEDDSLKVENNMDEVTTYTIDFTIALFAAAVILYVIDIIIRKLTWADIRTLFKRTQVPGANAKKGG